MTNQPKRLAVVATLLVLAIVGLLPAIQAEQPERAATQVASTPRLVVVQTTATWCKVCQSAKEAYASVTRQLHEAPVLFVTLDRSDDFSTRQSQYLADALGISEALGRKQTGVGELFIINAETKKLISKMSLVPAVDNMSLPIKNALAYGE